ncbi:MAG: NAD(P)H-dependent oxidoreductase [Bacteroidota bacterium]
MKQILLINGHPNKNSFNHALGEAYKRGGQKTNAKLSQINIAELNFNPNLKYGYQQRMELEPDLRTAIDMIQNAEHIVWIFPMWWYGYPAIMKGFVDRTFLPGITFEQLKGNSLPKKLLRGKTARIIVTSDSPRWYDFLFMKSPVINQFKKGTLNFCGIKPVKVTYIAPIKNSTFKFRQKWLDKIALLGENQQ